MIDRIFSRACACVRLILGLIILPCACPAIAQQDDAADEARRLFFAAHRLTHGTNFDAAVCAQAVPLLSASITHWATLPEAAREDDYPQLQLGRCLLTAGDAAGAAARFQYILDKPFDFSNVNIISHARLMLADLYAEGRGVARDRERALGLYLLAQPQTWNEQRHRDRAAAELIYALTGGYKGELFHSLLERDVASNWQRSLAVRRERNDNSYELVHLGIRALSSSRYNVGDAQEQAAVRALSLDVGRGLLAWGDFERLPAALVYLQRADADEAAPLLESIEKKLPYRLVMPDGTPWSVGHAQP